MGLVESLFLSSAMTSKQVMYQLEMPLKSYEYQPRSLMMFLRLKNQ